MKQAWKTTEFWLTFAATVAGIVVGTGILPEQASGPVVKGMGAVIAALSVMGYNVSRAYEKARAGVSRSGIKTTEFWLSSGAAVVGMLTSYDAFPGGSVGEKLIGAVSAGLAFLGYSAGRGIAKGGSSSKADGAVGATPQAKLADALKGSEP